MLYEIPDALGDIAQFEMLEAEEGQQRTPSGSPVPRMQFYPPQQEDDAAHMRVKLYLTEPKTLSETLPVLDAFGLSILDERSYTLNCADGTAFHLYDLGLCYPAGWIRTPPSISSKRPTRRCSPGARSRTSSPD